MTKFKEYARSKGIRLECDYECMPCNGLEYVRVLFDRAAILEYYNQYGWVATYIRTDGRVIVADPSREEIAAAINYGRAWWDQTDPEEVTA